MNAWLFETQMAHANCPPAPAAVETDDVTWYNFAKAPMPNRQFTFWDWFYSIVELVSKHMSGPWADGTLRETFDLGLGS